MREQTEAQLRPNIVISVAPRTGTTLLCLTVKNTGRSPAVSLRMKLDRDFFKNGEKREGNNVAALSAFTNPIENLAPESQLIFNPGVDGTVFGSQSDPSIFPMVFSVQASYHFSFQEYAEKSTIDIRPMLSSTFEQDPVAEGLKRLREFLEPACQETIREFKHSIARDICFGKMRHVTHVKFLTFFNNAKSFSKSIGFFFLFDTNTLTDAIFYKSNKSLPHASRSSKIRPASSSALCVPCNNVICAANSAKVMLPPPPSSVRRCRRVCSQHSVSAGVNVSGQLRAR